MARIQVNSILAAGSLCVAAIAPTACSSSETSGAAGTGTQASVSSSASGGGGEQGGSGQGGSGGSSGQGGGGQGGGGQGGGGQGGGGQGGGGQGGGGSASGPCDFKHDTEVDVTDAKSLEEALDKAAPGTLIRLAAGTYTGHFEGSTPGTPAKPIVLCGPREAVLDGGSTSSGYVFHLTASSWILSGFTVTQGKKGIMIDGASQCLLTGLVVHTIGDEAVHFRAFSSQNTISFSEIRDTGLENPGFGEGVYLGSAVSNWATITGSSDTPDTSDGNKVLNNEFGPGITAEHIDVKEGTTGGEVQGNTFHGEGISGANYADSWMDVKGSGYLIAGNTGFDAPLDGFQTHVAVDGWGNDNIFTKNVANVNGPGVGFSVAKQSTGNVVRCDNMVNGANAGFANTDCVP